jgi:diguanylate cyclase (GGDEF)-like protein
MPAAALAAIVAVLLLGIAVALLAAGRARAQLRVERLRARIAEERHAAFVESVRRLGAAALRSATDVHDEIDAAVRRLAPSIDCVMLFDEEEGELACTYAAGARIAYFAGARIARGDLSLLPARALRAGHRVMLGEGLRPFHPGDAFALAVPLPRDDGRASVLSVAAAERVDDAAADALAALADHAAFAYALAQERERDRRRAEYDALTGLLTPRALRERLGVLLERARNAPLARLAVLFIDTDRFKQWNDTYGHACGDALLRAIARTLRDAVGPGELAARNGGDEFCLVFADTEKSAAIERAERVRSAIARIDFAALRPAGADSTVRVTASIGVAAAPVDASSAHDLLECADRAMYHVKHGGRDGVAYAAPDGTFVRATAPAVATP